MSQDLERSGYVLVVGKEGKDRTTAMRGAVSSGALIVNYSAVSGPSY